MSINPLASNVRNLISPNEALRVDTSRVEGLKPFMGGFETIFDESLAAAGVADKVDKASSLELLMGQTDDLSGLMLDMQRAELSLNLALQIRNKVLDAYNEVMRMSV